MPMISENHKSPPTADLLQNEMRVIDQGYAERRSYRKYALFKRLRLSIHHKDRLSALDALLHLLAN
jgi:hypothetical protein